MESQIRKELLRLEHQHDIKILYAVESGSRAWGFASSDSDWDVRYIYIHRFDWYLQIDDPDDHQSELLSNKIDLVGWELKKTLKLFRKSNSHLFEWLGSPVVYCERRSTVNKLRGLIKEYFNPKSCLLHYLNNAEKKLIRYLQEETVNIKIYFYVIRPVLACHWIKKFNTMPPTEFSKLINGVEINQKIKKEINNLLSVKISGNEPDDVPKIQILNDFLEKKILQYKDYVESLNHRLDPSSGLLNKLFIKTLNEVWK